MARMKKLDGHSDRLQLCPFALSKLKYLKFCDYSCGPNSSAILSFI